MTACTFADYIRYQIGCPSLQCGSILTKSKVQRRKGSKWGHKVKQFWHNRGQFGTKRLHHVTESLFIQCPASSEAALRFQTMSVIATVLLCPATLWHILKMNRHLQCSHLVVGLGKYILSSGLLWTSTIIIKGHLQLRWTISLCISNGCSGSITIKKCTNLLR